jgi:branched-chain amino acid transport system ATP-binding protein
MNDGSPGTVRAGVATPAAGVLDVHEVTVRFGGLTALDNVSLNAVPRQVTGIIGPNGAGKTTLLNVLCGFVRPNAGRIRFGGQELTALRPHQLAGLRISRTLQGVGLFRGLSVLENVMVGATSRSRAGFWSAFFGLPQSDRDERMLRERALQALERVGAAGLADLMPESLAYGLRKRVALARALVVEPRLLLLDEPAGGLSENELPELGELIVKLAEDATVVVIEHRMDLMMSACDSIVVLDFGKVIATGTPDAVQSDPAVTTAYLGAEVSSQDRPAGGPGAQNRPGAQDPSGGQDRPGAQDRSGGQNRSGAHDRPITDDRSGGRDG